MRNVLILILVSLIAAGTAAADDNFFPISVWYGGGKARAPMLTRDPLKERDAWRRDLQQIKSLGFNTVRMWADWASTEPVRGQYKLEYVDQMMDLAEEQGLKVIIQIYTDSAPEWLGKRYPEAAFITHLGTKIISQASPGYCMDHTGVREDLGNFISAVAKRVEKRKSFHAWDLWSEPHIVNWVWLNFPHEFCFCPSTQAKFRAWLKERYGSLDRLNAAWYRTFEQWEDVEAPRYDTLLSYSDFIDWKRFISHKLAGDLKFKADSVKRVRRDFLATSHAANAGVLTTPIDGTGRADDWHMNEAVDYYGCSLYPKHASGTQVWGPVRFASAVDSAYSASGGRGFYVGELQAGQGATGVRVAEPVSGDDMRIWALTAIAHGARAINFYAYYTMNSGYESNGYGMIELDGAITERSREAGKLAKVVHANSALLLGAKPRAAEVGVIYNWLSYFTGGNTIGPGNSVRDSMAGIYRAFYERNIPVEFIHADQFAASDAAPSLRRFKVIYLPYPLMLNAATARGLKEWVRNGGALVSEARPGWNDERGFANDRIPGAGLDEVFGAREALLRTVEATEFVLADGLSLPGMKAGEKVKGHGFEEQLEVTGQAQVLGRYANGAAALTSASFGKGRAVLVGSFIGIANHRDPASAAGRLLAAFAQQAGVRAPVELSGSTSGLEARVMEGNGYRLLFLLNQGSQKVSGRATLGGAGKGRDLYTGQSRAFPLEFSLEPLGTMVVEVR